MIPQTAQNDLPIDWEATDIFYRNQSAREPIILNIGGARSSKSYSIIQLMVAKFFSERNKTYLTTRKTFPSLRITAYKVAIEMLQSRGLYGMIVHNKSQNSLFNPYTNSHWYFVSIDDPQKIRSTEFNYAHMEEANEFNYEDFRILKLRMSGAKKRGEINQIYLSLNPSDETGWIKTKLMAQEKYCLIHSTYRDNPFLSPEYVEELENLRQQDDLYWKIYGLGVWGEVRELIFGAPIEIAAYPSFDEEIFGLDFGFNNPTALLSIGIKDMNAYHREVIYQTRLTNSELIDLMKEKMTPYQRKRPIYADSAEPARIAEINNAGFNVIGATKNVRDGIDFTKRYRHYALPDQVNFIREWGRYKWRKDRRTDLVLDEPVKFEDHFPDAGRMALYSHLGQNEGGAFIGMTKSDLY